MQIAEAECFDLIEGGRDLPKQQIIPQFDYSRRIEARGKFLFCGDEKFWVKGITYGTFAPGQDGQPFPSRDIVAADFSAMAKAGINTVRTYTPPPVWLLDLAQKSHLRVMAGIAWEQHVTFLDNPALLLTIESRVREGVRSCTGHPAILCFSIGNEIPAQIVRWHGRRKIERFIKRLYRIAKQEDPHALVTYVNYPTTEYLQLDFLDLCSFNVYLETETQLSAYLARLQNLSGDSPLLMAEIGLDSQRNGVSMQAEQLAWQVGAAFAAGCCGTIVFSWTDEWFRGGHPITDWDFGLVTRERLAKPALAAVSQAYGDAPFPAQLQWPRISVVVCSYCGANTIRDTLEYLSVLDYPDFEIIVVDDGSTDDTAAICREYDVKLVSTDNRGLSNARNTGWQMATGEIVAYTDDDAYPDPHWLKFLAFAYIKGDYAAVGGLSLAPAGGGSIADCVANAPGRPVHVLFTDTLAEHIPGCNMSFRRAVLEDIGGFDPRYRSAGDDVDICWRILDCGWNIGFHAGAQNWHHCRNSLRAYWKQQQGYGKAEALLEEKWPGKYNSAGHLTWQGRLYGRGLTQPLPAGRWRIYQGQWGGALFQSLYQPAVGWLPSLPLMPEWYFVIAVLASFSLLGLAWYPFLWAAPILVLAVLAPVVQAVLSAIKAEFPTAWIDPRQRFRLRCISSLLHLIQPLARLYGRLRYGLTPWRKRAGNGTQTSGRSKEAFEIWSEAWRSPGEYLGRLEQILKALQSPMVCGGNYDGWDIEVRGGLMGSARLIMATEEHGAGKQLLKFAVRSNFSTWGVVLASMFGALGAIAAAGGNWIVGGLLCGIAVVIVARKQYESMMSMTAIREALKSLYLEFGNASSQAD